MTFGCDDDAMPVAQPGRRLRLCSAAIARFIGRLHFHSRDVGEPRHLDATSPKQKRLAGNRAWSPKWEGTLMDRQRPDGSAGTRGSSALLCVDLQVGFTRGKTPLFDVDRLLETVGDLQRAARKGGLHVIHIRFDGPPGHATETHSPHWMFEEAVAPAPDDIVVGKESCDSFFQSDLEKELRRLAISKLYVAGCITEMCIDSTSRSAASLGYDVSIISDAHSTPDGTLSGCPAPAERIRWFNHVMSRIGNSKYRLDLRDSSAAIRSWLEPSQPIPQD